MEINALDFQAETQVVVDFPLGRRTGYGQFSADYFGDTWLIDDGDGEEAVKNMEGSINVPFNSASFMVVEVPSSGLLPLHRGGRTIRDRLPTVRIG